MNIFRRGVTINDNDLPPAAPPPRGSVQQIPAAAFHGRAAREHTRQQVDMLVLSKGYEGYNRHRIRFENLTYLSAFGLLGLFGFTYADFIAMIATGRVPSADAVGTLLLVGPDWLSIALFYLAALVLFPCAFMTPWSSLFFELDEWRDVKGVLFFQFLAACVTSLVPFYHFGTVHQPAKTLEQFCWNLAAIAAPSIVGGLYYVWRSQRWQRAVAFTTVPLWVVPVVFGALTFFLYDVAHSGAGAITLSPRLLWANLLAPNVRDLRHYIALFELHSWTALIFSYLWYILPKFV